MTEDRHLTPWLRALRSAERELDEARLRSDLNRAARRLMDAKHELARLGVDWRPYLSGLMSSA
jgi:hypothetical protein